MYIPHLSFTDSFNTSYPGMGLSNLSAASLLFYFLILKWGSGGGGGGQVAEVKGHD